MIYIYDILLNLNKELIEFFEWNENDNIKYIKKIPIYSVDNNFINNAINNKIIVDKEFLKEIENKTIFDDNSITEKYKYICLFTNKQIIIGVAFDSNGIQFEISRLLIDEEKEVLLLTERLKVRNILYELIKKGKTNFKLLTRNEIIIKDELTKEINKLYLKNDFKRLNYYYYEYYNNISNNNNYVYKSLIDSLNSFNSKHLMLYNIIKLSYQKR